MIATPGGEGLAAREVRAGAEVIEGLALGPMGLGRPSWQPRPVIWPRALTDVLSVLLAFLCSHRLYAVLIDYGLLERSVPPTVRYVALALCFGLGVVGFGLMLGAYRSGTSVLQFLETRAAVRAVWLTAAFLFAILFLLKIGEEYSRILLTSALALSLIAIVLARRVFAPYVQLIQKREGHRRRVVIVGSGQTGRLLMKKLVQAPSAGLSLVGFVDDHLPLGSRLSCRLRQGFAERFEVPVLGRTWNLREIQAEHDVQFLLLNLPDLSREAADDVVRRAEETGLEIGLVPSLGDVRADLLELQDLTAIPILTRSPVLRRRVTDVLKRIADLVVAVPALVVTSPLWLLMAICVRLDSPGPVFFRQVRVGQNGTPFVMLKFRSMRFDSDKYAISPSTNSDPRITRFGSFLRASGLDELPQLLNVLRGDMSLVGPRPEMPFIVERYDDLEKSRLLVKPGVTGLWQLSPDRDDQIHENLEYDLYYVRYCSGLLDLLILLETVMLTLSIPVRRAQEAIRRRRRSQDRREHGISDGSVRAGFLLLALDQRIRAGEGQYWAPCLEAVHSSAGEQCVRVLVAPRNVSAMSRAIDKYGNGSSALSGESTGKSPADVDGGPRSNGDTTSTVPTFELVPYRGSDEVAGWASSVRMVVTDVRHIRDQVLADTDNTVVFVNDSGWISIEGPSDASVRPLVHSLKDALWRARSEAARGPSATIAN